VSPLATKGKCITTCASHTRLQLMRKEVSHFQILLQANMFVFSNKNLELRLLKIV